MLGLVLGARLGLVLGSILGNSLGLLVGDSVVGRGEFRISVIAWSEIFGELLSVLMMGVSEGDSDDSD